MSSRYPLSTKDSKLDASVLDLAYLYAAYAKDRVQGTDDAPTFADAVRMHRLNDLIEEASSKRRPKNHLPSAFRGIDASGDASIAIIVLFGAYPLGKALNSVAS